MPARAPRVATRDSFCTQKRAFYHAVFSNRLNGILRTRWAKAAMKAHKRTQRPLIHFN